MKKSIFFSILLSNFLVFQLNAQCFDPAVNYPVGYFGLMDITSGDFDNDGIADLAIINGDNNGMVHTLLGYGNGSFATGLSQLAGYAPATLTTTDVNGDGILDLAVGNGDMFSINGGISILTGWIDWWDSGFEPPVTHITGPNVPVDIATADFNGDGFMDLVTTETYDSVVIALSNGDTSFTTIDKYEGGSGPSYLTTADFNGDGFIDIATSNFYSNNVSIFLGNGNGTFANRVNYAAGSEPNDIAVADFNGDGITDIAVPNASTNNISVLLGNGNGTFATRLSYSVAGLTYVAKITVGDFNGDGFVDLASSSEYSTHIISILPGMGNGTFGTAVNYPVTDAVYELVSDDFNGDGLDDLAALLVQDVSIFLSNDVQIDLGPDNVLCNGSAITLDAGTHHDVSYMWSTGDNTQSINVTSSGNYWVDVSFNNGCGTFSDTIDLSFQNNNTSSTITPTVCESYTSPSGNYTWTTSGTYIDIIPNNVGCDSIITVNLTINNSTASISPTVCDSYTSPSGNYTWINSGTYTDAIPNVIGCDSIITINLTILTGTGTNGFAAAVNYPADDGPFDVISADFNGDGHSDIVSVNFYADNASILLGNGNGTFATATNFSVGSRPSSVTTADFNGDGFFDLALTRLLSNYVTVLLGNGNGTFSAPVNYSVGNKPRSLYTTDFNNDGIFDLAVSNIDSDNISILLGNGNGTFAAKVNYPVGDNPGFVIASDINGDNIADLMVTNLNVDNVSILIGSGSGTFAAAVNYPAGLRPFSITTGDYNGDGYNDLAVTNILSDNISVLLGIGNGTFGLAVNYPTNIKPISIVTTDINGDGLADLAVANQGSNNMSVLLGNGNGTFGIAINYNVGSQPRRLTSADFNGDGLADIAVANETSDNVSILLNTISPPVNLVAVACDSYTSPSGNYTWVTSGTYMDTIPSTSGCDSIITVNLTINNSSSSTINPVVCDSYTSPSGDYTWTSSGTYTDTVNNAIGCDSIITVNLTVTASTGSGAFAAAVNYPTSFGPSGVIPYDFNGDGFTDFAVTNNSTNTISIILGGGNGTFASPVSYLVGNRPLGIVTTDFNGDGFTDLAVANSYSNNVSILLGNGTGTFAAQVNYPVGNLPAGVTTADFNGDGFTDLAVANMFSDSVSILLGSSNGTFTAAVDYMVGAQPRDVTSADFNGDGFADLASSNHNSHNISILLGNGNGTFMVAVNYLLGYNSYPNSVINADFNSDGFADLAVTNGLYDNVSILLGSGTGTFASPVYYPVGDSPNDITPSDFNGDGIADLVVANWNSDNISVLLGIGNGTFANRVNYSTGDASRSVCSSDFNGDGIPDLAVTNNYSDNLSILLGIGITNSILNPVACDSYISPSGNYIWTQSGTYMDTIPSTTGCDSIITVNLTINNSTASTISPVVCNSYTSPSGNYIWTTSGTYTDVLTNAAGCDSTITVNLTVNSYSITTSSINPTTCDSYISPSGNYTWTSSGTYIDTIPNADVCDSVITINLTINNSTSSTIDPVACGSYTSPSGNYIWTSSGTYTDVVPNANGCDSIITVNLTVSSSNVISLSPAVQYPLSSSDSKSVAAADYNGDGFIDLAVSHWPKLISIFLGNGNGTFAFAFEYDQVFVEDLVAADVNYDGNVDLVATTGDEIATLLGIGNGNFAAPIIQNAIVYPLTNSGHTFHLATGDFNGDYNIDIVVSYYDVDSISLWHGNGSGGFVLWDYFSTGFWPQEITTADFDGDGSPDIAVANQMSGDVSLFYGDFLGNMTFAYNHFVGGNVGPITSADLDGDGLVDLAIADYFAPNVSILLNTGLTTIGNHFTTPVNYTAGTYPMSIVNNDYNGDGITDLAIANSGSDDVSVLLGNGNGTFATAVNYTVGSIPFDAATADFNGDGVGDIATANNSSSNFSVILSNTPGATMPLVNLGADTTSCSATPILLDAGIQPSGTYYLWNTGETTQTITVSASDNYWVSVSNIDACDTLSANDTINVIYGTSTYSTINPVACESYTALSGNYTWTSSGTYTDTIPNGTNCDSFITINLTILQSITSIIDTAICAGETIYGYNSSGSYVDTFVANNGCDSIRIVNLIAEINIALYPDIEWQNSFGGSNFDRVHSADITSDGGYVVAGSSLSNDGDVTGNHGNNDYWVVKLDSLGNLQWQNSIGGSDNDIAAYVEQTTDGGYFIAGHTKSTNGDVASGNQGDSDYWVVKLDNSGNLEWENSFGGVGTEQLRSAQQTSDGGYIVAGISDFPSGDRTSSFAGTDFWIVKMDGLGNLQWENSYGGSGSDGAESIRQTSDGGYIIAGISTSTDNQVTINHGGWDYWIVKIDASGNLQWQNSFGGSMDDSPESIIQSADGGYIVTGFTKSNDGDVTNFKGDRDYWVVKIDDSGNLQWQKTLGGTNSDHAYSITQNSNLSYVIAGKSSSSDGDVNSHIGSSDIWVVKLNTDGDILWEKSFGGTVQEEGYFVKQISQDDYILVGNSRSANVDVTLNQGGTDYWVVKLNESINPYNIASCGNYASPSGNYIWTQSGIYSDTLPNTNGCDSVITVNLTINNSSSSTINPTACSSYTSPSGNYIWTSSGTYADTIPNTIGCDSIITVNLTVGPSFTTSITTTYVYCDNQGGSAEVTPIGGTPPYTYEWDYNFGNNSQATGLATDWHLSNVIGLPLNSVTTTDASGCSVVDIVHIEADSQPPGNGYINTYYNNCEGSACLEPDILPFLHYYYSPGGDYQVDWGNGSWPWQNNDSICVPLLSNPTTYSVTVTDNYGCYYEATTTVSPGSPKMEASISTQSSPCGDTVTLTADVQFGTPIFQYYWNTGSFNSSITVTTSGLYSVDIWDANNCDTTVSINVTINSNYTNSTINPVACASYTSPSGNYIWTVSGTYNDVLINAAGCDSTITVNLTINNSSSSVINPVACGSYSSPSGNNTWTSSGTYMDTIPNSLGCDSVITVNLTIGPSFTTNIITDYVWCDNQGGFAEVTPSGGTPPYTYQWSHDIFNSSYQATGLATDWHLSNVLGFPLNSVTTTDASGCSVVDTFNIESAGLSGGEYLITNYNNCEGIVCLEPDILPNLHFHYGVGGDYEVDWGNGLLQDTICVPLYSNSVTYSVTITDDYGCYSYAEATVSPGSPKMEATISTQSTACGDSVTITANVQYGTPPFGYYWNTGSFSNSITATTSGFYIVDIWDANNCDTTVSINLTINSNNTTSIINPVVCYSYTSPSGNYTWSSSGIYADTIPNAIGCDSIITVNLTINNGPIFTIDPIACDSYTSPSGNYTWTSSGTYLDTIPNPNGCDITFMVNLTINYSNSSVINPVVCDSYTSPSGIYTWTAGGTYTDVITNVAGCDSTITVNLTINNSTASTINPIACDSYTSPSGNTWTTSGTYTDVLPNAAGCDSTITVNLTINSSTSSTINPVACDSYTSPSGNYTWTSSGTYTDVLTNANGCDNTVTVNLTINNSTNSVINPVVCDSYTAPSGNYTWTSSGTYTDVVPNAAGCDSTITVNLSINSTSSTINPVACVSYTSPSGKIWTGIGSVTFTDTITNAAGCDSIITINLTTNNITIVVIDSIVCDSFISPSGNYIWTTSGTHMDTIPSADANGCDIIFWVNLQIVNHRFTIDPVACDSYNSLSGNYTWTSSGTYMDTIPNPSGCDNIFTVNLTINNSTVSTINPTACDSYTSPSGNSTWTSSGSYTDLLPNESGCDSTITVNLTINNSTSSTINPVACDSYTSPSGNYTWTSSGTYTDVLTNATGCDSTITVNLTINNSSSSTINPVACGSYISPSGNYTWTTSGTYTDVIPNANGCDSTVTVNLTINNSTSSTINPLACDSYTSPSGNYTWTSSGTYMDTIPNANGCHNIFTVNLTINNSTSSTINPVACDSYTSPSGNYTWTSSGTYMDTIPNSVGCDSVITINLTFIPSTGSGTFTTANHYSTDGHPWGNPMGIASNDFNGDGYDDLAVANYNSNTISILLAIGNGAFNSKVDYPSGDSPTHIAIGHFNNDSALDLAVTNLLSDSVAIYLGNGNGTFGPAVSYPADDNPNAIVSEDFNGDGFTDLAVTHIVSQTLSILLSNGNGTFAQPVNIYSGGGLGGLATADVNGDGIADIMVTDNNNVAILIGNGNAGFNLVSVYSTVSGPSDMSTSDFNGDGFTDIALLTSGVIILLGDGTGTFTPGNYYIVGDNPNSIVTSDFNDDGFTDLALSNGSSGNISVLLGYGNGNFIPPVNYALLGSPRSITKGDFNDDGVQDLAATNYSALKVSVFLGIKSSGISSVIAPVECSSYTSPSGNYTWTQSGIYMDTILNATGCDSIITVSLTINSTNSVIDPVACGSYTSPSGNYTWTSSGTYTDDLTNAAGCDSSITVNLTINNSSSSTINPVACDSYISPSGNYTWTSSGTYKDTIPNAVGCDSVIKVNLTINNSTTYYADTDSDGYGDAANTIQACSLPAGYVIDNTDCNDNNGAVYPGAVEVCDGLDNNCDGNADEGLATTASFPTNPLTHSGSGFSSTSVVLNPAGNNPSFTISNIDARINGKPSNRYIEEVTVTYMDGNGQTQNYGTFSGDIVSLVNVNITGVVQSITVSLVDGYDGNSSTLMSVSFSTIDYCGGPACPDADADGVCDVNDVCPGFDDNLIGVSCSDGDNCTTGDIYTISCNCEGAPSGDSDGDGVCDALDICPGGDDNIDTDGDGIPDFCDTGNCNEITNNFNPNPLTHSGNGFSSSAVFLGGNTDVDFTISNINAKTNGKASRRYIEEVTVTYVDGASQTITEGVYRGDQVSSASISISDIVQSVSITLADVYNGSTASTMSVDMTSVISCESGSSKMSGLSDKEGEQLLKAYPNPFSKSTTIDFVTNIDGPVSVDVYDLKGAIVTSLFSGEAEAGFTYQIRFDAGGLSQNMYIVRLTTATGVKYLKLLMIQ